MEFYDHALNQVDAALIHAITRARKTSIEDKTAWKVVFRHNIMSDEYWWNGCRYDVLALAKSLVLNRYHNVFIVLPDGRKMDRMEIGKAKY